MPATLRTFNECYDLTEAANHGEPQGHPSSCVDCKNTHAGARKAQEYCTEQGDQGCKDTTTYEPGLLRMAMDLSPEMHRKCQWGRAYCLHWLPARRMDIPRLVATYATNKDIY